MRKKILLLLSLSILAQSVYSFILVPERKNIKDHPFQPYKRAPDDPKEASNPVILVPGDGGSRLQANLTGKPKVVHYVCDKKTKNYYDLWLKLENFVPVVIDCWTDNMKLVFNETTMMSQNNSGVDIKVPGFGDTETVEWLDSSKWSPGMYFAKIVDMLVSWGYRRGKNVVGAPFDWRLAPYELNDYYISLKTIIEMVYRYNSNKQVVIIAHSMGNPVMNYFYHNFVDQDWKNKYLLLHISLGGAWGGSTQIVRLFSAGYNMDYYRIILPPSELRSMQRSFTSSALLFPSSAVWSVDDGLAITPNKNYSISNVEEFFTDINYKTGMLQYNMTRTSLITDAPGVEVHCMYGVGVKTPMRFIWKKQSNFPDSQPDITEYEDGDGTVNIRSLETCKLWSESNNSGKSIQFYNFTDSDHMDILSDKRVLKTLRSILYPNRNQTKEYY